MKKLTAGIFTVLLGAVSVNAADAAVASKGYVDGKVGANTTLITDLTKMVESNKTAADATATALSEYKTSNDAAVALKANAADVYSKDEADKKFEEQAAATQKLTDAKAYTDTQIKTLTDSLGGVGEDGESTGLTGTVAAQGVRITSLEDKVGDKSVADQIAESLADYSTTTEVDGKITSAVADLATKSEVNTGVANAIGDLDVTDAAVDNQFVTAVSETDGKITVSRSALTAENIPALEITKITGLQAALDAKQGALSSANGSDSITVSDTGIISVTQGAITTSLLAKDAVTTDNIADGAVTDAKITSVASEKVTGLADALDAKISVTSATTEAGKYVLTANVSADGVADYAWEQIERGANNE